VSESVGLGEQVDEAPAHTTADVDDLHVHEVDPDKVDENGNGVTEPAQGPGREIHSHQIVSNEVQDHTARDGSYTSKHPGGIVGLQESVRWMKEGPVGLMHFLNEAARDSGDPRGKVWDVVLITAGVSANIDPILELPRWYPKETLLKLVEDKVFEGKAANIFEFDTPMGPVASHTPDGVPSGMFPRQKVGWYDDVRFGKFEDHDGTMKEGVLAKFHLVDADLRQPLVEAWDQGKKDFLDLSINAGGLIEEAEIGGQKVAKVVEISVGESIDLVSEGARGGKLLRLVASKAYFSEAKMNKKQITAAIKRLNAKLLEGLNPSTMSVTQLNALLVKAIKEQEPTAPEGLRVQQFDDEFCLVMPDGTKGQCFPSQEEAQAALAAMAQEALHQIGETIVTPPVTPAAPATPPAPGAPAAPATAPLTESAVDAIIQKRVDKAMWPSELDKALASAKLPEESVKHLLENYRGRVGDRASLTKDIDYTKKMLGLAADASQAGGEPGTGGVVTITEEVHEKVEKGIRASFREARGLKGTDAFVDKVAPIRSISRAYASVTGDHRRGMRVAHRMLEGFAFAQLFMQDVTRSDKQAERLRGRLKEALETSSWPQVLGNALEKERLEASRAEDVNKWREITSKIGSTDNLFTKRRIRIGGYGEIPIVGEGVDFPAAVSPADQEVQIDLDKRGFTEEITIEMMLRDDINQIAEIPNRMIRAGMLTLQRDVFNILINNEALSFDDDTTALFTAPHGNLSTTALSRVQVLAAMESMMSQNVFGSDIDFMAEQNMPDILLVDFTQWDEAMTIAEAPFTFGVANEFQLPSNIKGKIRKVLTLSHSIDINDWFLVNSRGQTIEMIFMDGMEEPEMFVQDMPNVGATFTADKILWKLRHWWGREVIDFRPFFGGVVA